jgi:hypothetical protein
MFTREVLFGMNIVTLAGFVVMGIGLALNRQGRIAAPVAFALMGAGTGVMLLGLYIAPAATP